jgi:hypothetical protein
VDMSCDLGRSTALAAEDWVFESPVRDCGLLAIPSSYLVSFSLFLISFVIGLVVPRSSADLECLTLVDVRQPGGNGI